MAHFLSPLNRILFSWGNFHLRAWRLNMLLNSTPGFLAIILMWMLPETAKFLISVGKMDRAYETLNRLCLKNRGTDLASLGITGVFQADLPESTDKRKFCESLWYDTVPLFKPPYLKNFLICTVILSGYFFVWVCAGWPLANSYHILSPSGAMGSRYGLWSYVKTCLIPIWSSATW